MNSSQTQMQLNISSVHIHPVCLRITTILEFFQESNIVSVSIPLAPNASSGLYMVYTAVCSAVSDNSLLGSTHLLQTYLQTYQFFGLWTNPEKIKNFRQMKLTRSCLEEHGCQTIRKAFCENVWVNGKVECVTSAIGGGEEI